MNIFSAMRRNIFPAYLGVDIGTASIKIVEVKAGKQLPRLSNYALLESNGHLVRANKVLQTSSFKIFEAEAAEMIKTMIAKMKCTTDAVIASIPSFSAFTTVLDFPDMKPSELTQAMEFQARQYIPLPISEVALDWLKVGEYQDEKGFKHQQILLISVPNDQIKRYQQIFKMAGLRLTTLEIESLSAARSLVGSDQTPTMIVDMGARSTNIAFVERGQLKFNAQTDYAASSITQALANAMHINPLRAEELKRQRGIIGTGPSFELSTIMVPFLDVIIGEVKKALYNYKNQFPKAGPVERIILAGGGANLLGIEKYVQRELGIPTAKAAPFFRFEYPSDLEPLTPELSGTFSVSLGLVLKEFLS